MIKKDRTILDNARAIKAYCSERNNCHGCAFQVGDEGCIVEHSPMFWDFAEVNKKSVNEMLTDLATMTELAGITAFIKPDQLTFEQLKKMLGTGGHLGVPVILSPDQCLQLSIFLNEVEK